MRAPPPTLLECGLLSIHCTCARQARKALARTSPVIYCSMQRRSANKLMIFWLLLNWHARAYCYACCKHVRDALAFFLLRPS